LTLKLAATRPAAGNVLQQQARFDHFLDQYNRERPHQALDMKVPAESIARQPGRTTAWRNSTTRSTIGAPS
jgi:putative transposase